MHITFTITPDNKYLFIAYGIVYLYCVNLKEKRIIKEYHLFPEYRYNLRSYRKINRNCFYQHHIRIDFSKSSKYALVRVKGDYDPVDEDEYTSEELVTPVFFRTFFLINISTLEIILTDNFDDVSENDCIDQREIASYAFNTDETLLAIGALGNDIKIFNINTGKVMWQFGPLAWVYNPRARINCRLMFFKNNRFIFVDNQNQIEILNLKGEEYFVERIIKPHIPTKEHNSHKWEGFIRKIAFENNFINCFIKYDYFREDEMIKIEL